MERLLRGSHCSGARGLDCLVFTIGLNSSGKIYFYYNAGAFNISSNNSYNDNAWHHLTVIIASSGLISMYVDNVLLIKGSTCACSPSSCSLSSGLYSYHGPSYYLTIGGYYGSVYAGGTDNFFTGQIGPILIYNSALTSTQINTNYTYFKSAAQNY